MDIRRKAATSCPDGRFIQPTHETTQMSHESEGGRDHLDRKSTVTPAHSIGCSVGRKGEQLLTLTGWQSPEAHSPCPGFWYTLTIKVGTICLESETSNGRSPFLDLQMGLGFSRPCALHTSLERALLGASGHTAAYFIHLAEALQSKPKF